jgi:PAS domain S-box-containing protein
MRLLTRAEKLNLSQKGALLICIPFLVQVAFFLYSGRLLTKSEQLASYEYRSKAVIGHVNWIIILASLSTNGMVGYVVTHKPFYLSVYKQCSGELPKALAGLHDALDGAENKNVNDDQVRAAALQISHELASKLSSESSLRPEVTLKSLDSESFLDAWRRLYIARHDLLRRSSEGVVKTGLEDLPTFRILLRSLVAAGVALNILAGIYLIYAYNRHIAKRLSVLSDNATRLAKGDDLIPAGSGSDEIASLDATFHQMADDLSRGRKVLEENERYLSSLIKNLPVGVITLSENGLVSAVNSGIIELFGYQESELVGKELRFLFPDLATDLDDENLPLKSWEFGVQRKDGVERTVELTLRSYNFSDRPLTLAAVHDITERRELEQLRQDFLNMVSHDLRSPLQGVKLSQELLLRGSLGELPDKAKQTIQKAERNIERMIDLINDLLDFEKLQYGQLEFDIESLQLYESIEASIEVLQAVAGSKQVQIHCNDCKIQVLADKRRLMQVLVNLLSNAIKFSPASGVIEIAAESNDGMALVKVIDQGPGIAHADQTKVFEKFRQLSDGQSPQKEGTGLGLPICKSIIEQLGGKIGVESNVGKGSTFWFTIPLQA